MRKRNLKESDIKNFLFIIPELTKSEENKWIKECGLYENALKYIKNISKETPPHPSTLPMPPSNWLKT